MWPSLSPDMNEAQHHVGFFVVNKRMGCSRPSLVSQRMAERNLFDNRRTVSIAMHYYCIKKRTTPITIANLYQSAALSPARACFSSLSRSILFLIYSARFGREDGFITGDSPAYSNILNILSCRRHVSTLRDCKEF